jgi:hypothetical protein
LRRASIAVLGAALVALSAAPAGRSQDVASPAAGKAGDHRPVELWRAFPLGSAKLQARQPSLPAQLGSEAVPTSPVSTALSPPGRSGGVPTPVWYALVGLVGGLACGGAVLLASSRRSGGAAESPGRPRPRAHRPADELPGDLVSRVAAYRAATVRTEEEPAAAAESPVTDAPTPLTASVEGQPHADTMVLEREGHVLVAPSEKGYALFEVRGEPPAPGELLDGNELGLDGQFTVASVGPSPLDDDPRECAFLVKVA